MQISDTERADEEVRLLNVRDGRVLDRWKVEKTGRGTVQKGTREAECVEKEQLCDIRELELLQAQIHQKKFKLLLSYPTLNNFLARNPSDGAVKGGECAPRTNDYVLRNMRRVNDQC